MRRLADLVVHREPGNRDVPEAGIAASLELVSYYAELARDRRAHPTDDLTSALIQADLDGDRLSEEEIIAFLFLMVVAGNETTTKLLGHAVFHLAAHPDQQAEVFASAEPDGDLVGSWIEETLRYDTSSQHIARHVVEPFTLHGKTVPADAKMLLSLGSANRDDRVFTDPDRFDIHRDRAELSDLISFGGGRHFCLGAHLARLEARIALEELVRRVRTYSVAVAHTRRVHSSNVRGFASEPVTLELR
jgi:cytochrome P450